jgi:hypothetical protein
MTHSKYKQNINTIIIKQTTKINLIGCDIIEINLVFIAMHIKSHPFENTFFLCWSVQNDKDLQDAVISWVGGWVDGTPITFVIPN